MVTKPIVRQKLIAAILEACPERSLEQLEKQQFAEATQPPPAVEATASKGFAALVQRYRVSLANHLSTLQEAETRNDGSEICVIAHKISGTAGNYGFPEITTAAAQCEIKLRQGNSLQQLQPELTTLKTLLAGAASDT